MKKQILDPEEVWSMPPENNEGIKCVIAVTLISLIVVTLIVIL